MYAEAALQQSENNLIEADVRNGFVVIFQNYKSSENFHLYFIPRETDKNCKSAEMFEIGLYDDLDIAVTIASIGYGAYDSKWKPLETSRLNSLNKF